MDSGGSPKRINVVAGEHPKRPQATLGFCNLSNGRRIISAAQLCAFLETTLVYTIVVETTHNGLFPFIVMGRSE